MKNHEATKRIGSSEVIELVLGETTTEDIEAILAIALADSETADPFATRLAAGYLIGYFESVVERTTSEMEAGR